MPALEAILTRAVPVARPTDRPAAVLAGLAGVPLDSAGTVFLVDEAGCLVGQVRLTAVLARAGADVPLSDLPQEAAPPLRPDTDQEDAASAAIAGGVIALAVTDAAGRFVGAVTADAIIRILRAEHVQDLHHLAGIWRHTEDARRALEESPATRLRQRLPWLLIGLAGSMVGSVVVAGFETVLSRHVALAFFIPLIVYLADAVGTQTEAIAVRGLSLSGLGIRRLLGGEARTGLLIGTALALVAALVVWIGFGDPRLGLVVGLSLVAACALATTIGLALPAGFARLGWDPALASGPIATVVQDVLSLAIYFAIATAILP